MTPLSRWLTGNGEKSGHPIAGGSAIARNVRHKNCWGGCSFSLRGALVGAAATSEERTGVIPR